MRVPFVAGDGSWAFICHANDFDSPPTRPFLAHPGAREGVPIEEFYGGWGSNRFVAYRSTTGEIVLLDVWAQRTTSLGDHADTASVIRPDLITFDDGGASALYLRREGGATVLVKLDLSSNLATPITQLPEGEPSVVVLTLSGSVVVVELARPGTQGMPPLIFRCDDTRDEWGPDSSETTRIAVRIDDGARLPGTVMSMNAQSLLLRTHEGAVDEYDESGSRRLADAACQAQVYAWDPDSHTLLASCRGAEASATQLMRVGSSEPLSLPPMRRPVRWIRPDRFFVWRTGVVRSGWPTIDLRTGAMHELACNPYFVGRYAVCMRRREVVRFDLEAGDAATLMAGPDLESPIYTRRLTDPWVLVNSPTYGAPRLFDVTTAEPLGTFPRPPLVVRDGWGLLGGPVLDGGEDFGLEETVREGPLRWVALTQIPDDDASPQP